MNNNMEPAFPKLKTDSTSQLEFEWAPQSDQTTQTPAPTQTPPESAEASSQAPSSSTSPSIDNKENDQARKTLQASLETRGGRRISSLIITNNASTMMSVKYHPHNASAYLRLHHMFLSAPEEIIDALAQWVKSPRAKKSGDILNNYIRQNNHRRVGQTRNNSIITKGTNFDLRTIFDELNKDFFQNKISANITWGKLPEAKRRRSIRFGAYYPSDNIIRIHRFLDQTFVPPYFVRYIVFHEMLHAFLGIKKSPTGRQLIHSADFKALERQFPDYEKAIAWENNPKNLKKLLAKKAHFHYMTAGKAISNILFGKD
jgi:hypothetical protein